MLRDYNPLFTDWAFTVTYDFGYSQTFAPTGSLATNGGLTEFAMSTAEGGLLTVRFDIHPHLFSFVMGLDPDEAIKPRKIELVTRDGPRCCQPYSFYNEPYTMPINQGHITVRPVKPLPEPGTWALMIAGILGIGWKLRRT